MARKSGQVRPVSNVYPDLDLVVRDGTAFLEGQPLIGDEFYKRLSVLSFPCLLCVEEALWDTLSYHHRATSLYQYYDRTRLVNLGESIGVFFGNVLVIVGVANAYLLESTTIIGTNTDIENAKRFLQNILE